jgi:hypothetical protein
MQHFFFSILSASNSKWDGESGWLSETELWLPGIEVGAEQPQGADEGALVKGWLFIKPFVI